MSDHVVTAEPVDKMDGGVIGYRFVCTCGRRGNGHHRTIEQAIERGHDHIADDEPMICEVTDCPGFGTRHKNPVVNPTLIPGDEPGVWIVDVNDGDEVLAIQFALGSDWRLCMTISNGTAVLSLPTDIYLDPTT